MEQCDIYDESGSRTGRTATRGASLSPGEYYLVVQVWIQDDANQYLVQRRAQHLASAPGMWATTAGYVVAGEESLAGAIREVREELGLQLLPAQLKRFDRLFVMNFMQDIWLAVVARSVLATPILEADVMDWKWETKAGIQQMVRQGTFFAYSYLNRLLV